MHLRRTADATQLPRRVPRRRDTWVAVLVLALEGLAGWPPAAHATGQLDQSSLPADHSTGIVSGYYYTPAQTFMAGRTGFLDAAGIEISQAVPMAAGRYALEVRSVTGAGTPSETVLASSIIDACRVAGDLRLVPFGPAARVTAGTRYALVLNPVADIAADPFHTLEWSKGTYGWPVYVRDAGTTSWRTPEISALAFATYVSATAPPAIARDSSETTISSSQTTAFPGEVTFSAIVRDVTHPDRTPAGSVLFQIDHEPTAAEPIDAQGHARHTFTFTRPQTATVTAGFCPTSDAQLSSGASVTQVIRQDRTATALTATPSRLSFGEPTVLTATVTDGDDGSVVPRGTVTFALYGQPLAEPGRLNAAGQATLTTSALRVGDWPLSAAYQPDDQGFLESQGNATVTVTKWASTSSVAVSPATTVAGQPATFTAAVTGSSADAHHPTGVVQFTEDDGTPIEAPVPLDATGHATLTVGGDAGSYRVHARYAGDEYFAASEASVLQTIDRADTATTISSDPNPVTVGALLTVAVAVDVLPPGDVDTDGALQFLIDDEPLGGPVDISGYDGLEVTLRAPNAPSTNTVTVRYLGGPNTKPSSASLRQTVAAAPSATTPPPPPPLTAPVAPSPTGAARPAAAQAIATMTSTLIAALQRRGLRALDGAAETFQAPSAGRLEQQVYVPSAPRGALPAAAKIALVASGSRSFTAAVNGRVTLKVTAAGRRVVRRKRAGAVRLQIVTRFTPTGGRATRTIDRMTIPAKPRSRGRTSLAERAAGYRYLRQLRGRPSLTLSCVVAWRDAWQECSERPLAEWNP
jgi:hypothetical protein